MHKITWRKGIISLLLSLILICLLTACTDRTPIKIGFSANLSGRNSYLGVAGRNGILLAVEMCNKNGGIKGRKIELIIKDDKGLPEEAIKVDQELIDEKVPAIIGHLTSNTTVAVIPTIEKAGALLISPTTSSESLTGKEDCFIRVISSNKYQGELLAVAASSKLSKKAAVIYDTGNQAYTWEVCSYFQKQYESEGGQIVLSKAFESGQQTHFADIAQDIVLSGADSVLISASGMDTAVLSQQLKKINPDIQIYTGMWAMTSDLLENGGEAIEGVYLAGVYDSDNKSEKFVNFKKAYIDRFREEPAFSSMYCYEAATMLFESILKSKQLDAKSIKDSLLKVERFSGLVKDFVIDKNGDTARSYFLITIKDGRFERVND